MPPASTDHSPKAASLDESVRQSLEQYFTLLGNQKPHALHEMVTQATERPLLDYVMKRYQGNVSHASAALGLTRNTLRRKLKLYGLDTGCAPKNQGLG